MKFVLICLYTFLFKLFIKLMPNILIVSIFRIVGVYVMWCKEKFGIEGCAHSSLSYDFGSCSDELTIGQQSL